LTWPWLALGFLAAFLLAGLAAWRVRDEEIPRLALLTAAFFVASSLHLKIGPTSVHLLLNGLVGVLLGRRAPLAILVGVTLQAALIPHGGFSTIGVNTCTQAIPALFVGWLFGLLHQVRWRQHSWFRALLVGASAFLWGGALLFGIVLLANNSLGSALAARSDAGLVFAPANWQPAWDLLRRPETLCGLSAFAALCAYFERRMENAPEFPLGLLVGVLAVLLTTALLGAVLLADGADHWRTFVTVVFLAHLPLAVVEGLVLGATVSFLARVKPQLLGPCEPNQPIAQETPESAGIRPAPSFRPPALLLALCGTLLFCSPASAHRLKGDYKVYPERQEVRVEGFYETDEIPEKATVKVLLEDKTILAEGPLKDGRFTFRYTTPQNLTVEINAPGGHRATLRIPASALGPKKSDPEPTPSSSSQQEPPKEARFRDLAIGVSLLLSAASFFLSVRNTMRLNGVKATPPPNPLP
jgi:ABC-type Co2+ transport system permease subunit